MSLLNKGLLSDYQLGFTLVLISPKILAYTDETNMIFINVIPLLGVETSSLRKRLLLSIAHELTHRSTKTHNSQFASEMAYLLFAMMEQT
jgi:hypothetical protein